MPNTETEQEKLEGLTRKLMQAYFIQRDYIKLLKYIATDISWFGTGAKEVCRSMSDAIQYLGQEQDLYKGNFILANEWYDVKIISDDLACVMAQMNVTADPASGYFISIPVRFSIVFTRRDQKWTVCHLHNSVPYRGQGDASFFDREAAKEDYSRMQEMALAVASGYLNNTASEAVVEEGKLKSAMEKRLFAILREPQTVQQVVDIFDDYTQQKRDIRRAQQIAGIDDARRRNVRLGRPPWTPPDGFAEIYADIKEGRSTKSEAARKLGITPAKMTRFCQRYEKFTAELEEPRP